MASDGLWDECDDQEAVEICRECDSAKQMARKLMDLALDRRSRDNITIIVLKF